MLRRTLIGKHPDTGAPYYHVECDGHVVLTGPATGDVTLADGTSYAVDADVIEVTCADPSRESCEDADNCHAGEVAHLIALQHEETGALDVPADQSDSGEHERYVHDRDSCRHCPEAAAEPAGAVQ